MSLTSLDYAIIGGALALMLVIAVTAARLARRSLEHYFLGGRNLPWYLLGVSGMSGWFDMTGTMIITSFLYLLGPLGLYIEFRGGVALPLAFMLAYANKWGRRSGCMTYAEWNTYRFGTDRSAELIRFVTAACGVLLTIGMFGYLVRGATLFLGLVFPIDPVWLTVGILGFASLYTIIAGFYGMVLTDLLQGSIMIASSVILSALAWRHVPDMGALSAAAFHATGNTNWVAAAPTWHVTVPVGYEAYHDLVLAAIFYLMRSLIGGLAGGAVGGTHPLSFAARNPRDASLMCLMQGLTIMFRWPLMISFAILGIFMVQRTVPHRQALADAASVIRAAEPHLNADNWNTFTSRVAHDPQSAPARLVSDLESILGPHWRVQLLLLDQKGTVDPELILPAVILADLKPGIRGLLLAAMLSALMGSMASLLNSTSALFVRDIYQNFLRPDAGRRELIATAYLSSSAIVVASLALGLHASSINELWGWLIMGLIAGTTGPTVLRLYWWRTNAWGMASGLALGASGAFIQRLFCPTMSEWTQFVLMTSVSFAATIIGSVLTPPVPERVVSYFYQTTRPFGFWKPFFQQLPKSTQAAWRREHRNDIAAVAVGLVWQVCLLMLPMEILTHNWRAVDTTSPIFILACVGLYFFWYRNLPSPNEEIPNFASHSPAPFDAITADEQPRRIEAQ